VKPASAWVVDRSDGETVVYDVVLLAGSPRRHSLRLAANLITESLIEVDGERWTVADVRLVDGSSPQLICIHAD
jgi:hypothetical protein